MKKIIFKPLDLFSLQLIISSLYNVYNVSSAPKLGGQSHPHMFRLIKISKGNIVSRIENEILGVYVKSERVLFKASYLLAASR